PTTLAWRRCERSCPTFAPATAASTARRTSNSSPPTPTSRTRPRLHRARIDVEWDTLQGWVTPSERDNVLVLVDAAYRQVPSDRAQRVGIWIQAMDLVKRTLAGAFARQGLRAPSLYMEALMDRLAPPAPLNQVEHLRLLKAC